jgi:hypothetical protein
MDKPRTAATCHWGGRGERQALTDALTDALGDALVVEVGDLFAEDEILGGLKFELQHLIPI